MIVSKLVGQIFDDESIPEIDSSDSSDRNLEASRRMYKGVANDRLVIHSNACGADYE